MLFDTHCHLDVTAFDGDRDEVYARARKAGVTRFLNPAFNLESSLRAISLADTHTDVYAAVGIHPNDLGDFSTETLAVLKELTAKPKVAAIGEIGLDYYWNTFSHGQQQQAFRMQLELAAQQRLPVIIHCRDACPDTLNMLAEYAHGLKILLHSFAGNSRDMQRTLSMGCYFGIGGPITFKNAGALRDNVSTLPLNRIVLETDSPYLAPHPHRGKRNEPGWLPLIAERVAALHGLELEQLAVITTATASAFFGLT